MSKLKSHKTILINLCVLTTVLSLAMKPSDSWFPNNEMQSNFSIAPLRFYTAGESILLNVDGISPEDENKNILLYISASYGSMLISPERTKDSLFFRIPSEVSKKSGKLFYQLYDATMNELDSGSLEIKPNSEMTPIAESYLGPQTIVSGGADYSMMVVIATDKYDNLVPDGTEVSLESFIHNSATTYTKITKDRIAWERLFSTKKSGRMLISGISNSAATKEKTLDIIPNNATNFSITEQLVHPYADGNQIAVLSTSVIKDEFNNTISDGTLVSFLVTTSEGKRLEVSGTTINGIATGQFLHPKNPTKWTVQAFIMGLAESSVKEIYFSSVIKELEVSFSSNNRSISIGPITSFMGQPIPDGAEVIVTIKQCDQQYTATTKNGMTEFELNPILCPNGSVSIEIESMGISETFEKTLH